MLKDIENKAKKELEKSKNLKELQGVFKDFLGKKGELSLVLRNLKNLPEKERVERGKKANQLKKKIEKEFEKKKKVLSQKPSQKREEYFDVTIPGEEPVLGHLHPITKTTRRIIDIFKRMGFEVADSPEIETEWYNFDALNVPQDHPARDNWDTFWVDSKKNLLLRAHTSPGQIRYMENNNPPLRIINPGKAFRHEATDASHEMQFYQVEGLMIDRETSASHFKAVLKHFFERFFNTKTNIRLTPDFFPFTEPSFEVAMSCLICGGKGCSVCKQTGWIELAGAGMVHPNVLKNCKIDHREWQGWAFGMGIDRLAMMRHKIDDIRLFHSGDLRFLKQF